MTCPRTVASVMAFSALLFGTTYTTGAQARCYEEFPIVGRSTCRKFGAWDLFDLPRLALNVGFSVHTVPLANATVMGSVDKTRSVGVPSAVFSGIDTTAVSFDWGPTGFVAGPHHLAAGFDFADVGQLRQTRDRGELPAAAQAAEAAGVEVADGADGSDGGGGLTIESNDCRSQSA